MNDEREELKAIFDKFDTDGSGQLDFKEILDAFGYLGFS